MSATVLYGKTMEDQPWTGLWRVCALNGTGSTIAEEGKLILQADVSTITAKCIGLGTNQAATSGTEITPAPTYTVAGTISDTLLTLGWPISKDSSGYNLRMDFGATYFPTGNEWTEIDVTITLTGGSVIKLKALVYAVPLLGS